MARIRTARHRRKFWNNVAGVALIIGALAFFVGWVWFLYANPCLLWPEVYGAC